MRIIIVGGGEVGKGLAQRLGLEDHHVTLVEASPEQNAELENRLDVLCVEGNGASARVLDEAGMKSADMLIAVSDSDECNMVACALAKESGVATTIARVRNEAYVLPDRGVYAKALNIDLLVNPDEVAAVEVREVLQVPVATNVSEFAEGKMRLVGLNLTPHSPLANRRLAETADLGFQGIMTVVAVLRRNELIIPSGGLRLENNDHISVMVRKEDLAEVNRLAGQEPADLNKVVIMGGSRAGAYLASQLENDGVRVVLIEVNDERAAYLADELEDSLVLCADGTDISVLAEAGVAKANGFVAASSNDEENILSALLAKEQGAKKVIAILRKPHYMPLLQHIRPIDTALNPRVATINAILRYVHQGKLLTVVNLGENQAEAIEVVVAPDSPVVGLPLKKNVFPPNVLVGGIMRGDEILVPHGDTVIEAGDRALVVASREHIRDINNLLSRARMTSRLRRFLTGKSSPEDEVQNGEK